MQTKIVTATSLIKNVFHTFTDERNNCIITLKRLLYNLRYESVVQ